MSGAVPVPAGRRDEVARLLDAVRRWAAGRPDLRAVGVVGSWARDEARPDSDVDVMLLSEDPAAYLASEGWATALGAPGVARTRRWGVVTERRVVLASGLEVEFGVTGTAWAATDPVDPGTRGVVTGGLVAVHDPDGLLAALARAVEA